MRKLLGLFVSVILAFSLASFAYAKPTTSAGKPHDAGHNTSSTNTGSSSDTNTVSDQNSEPSTSAKNYGQQKKLEVRVNNNVIKFDSQPYTKGGRTIVPVRAISEALGAIVDWDSATQTITITKDSTVVTMKVGDPTVYVNGEPVETTAPEVTNGRTFVPLRFLAETFGLNVNYDDSTGAIDVSDTGTDTSNTGDTDTGSTDTSTTDTSTADTSTADTSTADTSTADTSTADTSTAG